MFDYHNLIMGSDDSCFLTIFNNLWKKEIDSQNLPYTNAIQIEAGNRLRPLLMAWGIIQIAVMKIIHILRNMQFPLNYYTRHLSCLTI